MIRRVMLIKVSSVIPLGMQKVWRISLQIFLQLVSWSLSRAMHYARALWIRLTYLTGLSLRWYFSSALKQSYADSILSSNSLLMVAQLRQI